MNPRRLGRVRREAVAFGLSVGTLQAYVYLPRPQRLPSIAIAVVLLIGAAYAAWGPGGSTITGGGLVMSVIIAQMLVGGLRLAGDPGYWARVWLGFTLGWLVASVTRFAAGCAPVADAASSSIETTY